MEETFFVLDVDHVVEDGRPVIRLWGKTAKGKNITVLDKGFRPYFYVQADRGVSDRLKGLEYEGRKPLGVTEVRKRLYGKEINLYRVELELPADAMRFAEIAKNVEGVKNCYEHGINFSRRYMIDNELLPAGWAKAAGTEAVGHQIKADIIMEASEVNGIGKGNYPQMKVMAFDIEMIRDENKDMIIMISMADSSGFRRVLTHGGGEGGENVEILEDERGMISRFVDIVNSMDPDIVTGYNTDNFDFLKILDKCREYGIQFNIWRTASQGAEGKVLRIGGRLNIDLYPFVETILGSSLSSDVFTLDKVAREIIGKGKEHVVWKDVENAWKSRNIEMISAYCLQDSVLALELSDELIPQLFELCRISGVAPFDACRMAYSQLVEWLLMRKAYKSGEIIPNRPRYDEVMRRRAAPAYTGGYVHEPKEGIHEGIALFDFTALYPSIIITHNVSPDTLGCSCCKACGHVVPGYGHYYCSKSVGFVAGVLEEIISMRMEINRQLAELEEGSARRRSMHNRQYALKILSNAVYGYYGYPGSRWYSRVCAESITAWGRHYIKSVIGLAEGMGLNVIYGDTDSIFLEMLSKEDAKDFMQKANGSLPGIMTLDFKGLYRTGIFVHTKAGTVAKKRYALMDYSNNMLVRGFEKVRKDWAAIAKAVQENVMMAILRDRSPEDAIGVVKKEVDRLRSGSVDMRELVIYNQITRPLDKYEQVGPHVSAGRKMVERGKIIREGHTVGYVITKGVGTISQRAEPAEDAVNYDPEYYVNNQVVPAAMRIMGSLGYTESEVLEDKKQASLKGFLEK